jgi:hypothetical protein
MPILLIAALALGGLLWWVATPARPAPVTLSNSDVASAKEVGRATADVTQAGTVMSQQLAGLRGLPTVASVSAVVDPYLTALQRYQSALSVRRLSSRGDLWRRIVLVHVRSLETLLHDLPNTPSGELGSWINGFYLQTAELQNAIQGLDAALPGVPAS